MVETTASRGDYLLLGYGSGLRDYRTERAARGVIPGPTGDLTSKSPAVFDFELAEEETVRVLDLQNGLVDRVRSALGL